MPKSTVLSFKSTIKSRQVTPSSDDPTTSSNGKLSAEYLDRVKKKIAVKMDLVFDRCLALDTDFPICESPIWVFGRSYSIHYGKDLDGKDLDELRRTVATCMWLTYRKNFPCIGDTTLSSDKGWGCMIRAGQMVVAKALLMRHLGPDWHWEPVIRSSSYLKIVSLFADTRTSPLSIHQIAQSGASLGKPVGSWLGPNTVAQAFKKLLMTDSTAALDLEIFISMDSTVIKTEVKRSCLIPQWSPSSNKSENVPSSYSFNTPRSNAKWKPLLLIIPLRLGLSDLNPAYVPAFRAVFEVRQNLGMLGGRPNSALYFIGYAEDEVLFLDPHTVQPSVIVGSKIFETEKQADESYHIQKPGRMPFAAMDPSIAVCFYCKSEDDFESLCSKLSEKFTATPLPLFEICEHRPLDWVSSGASGSLGKSASSPNTKSLSLSPTNSWTNLGGIKTGYSNHRHNSSRSEGNSPPGSSGRRSDVDDEEFEILG